MLKIIISSTALFLVLFASGGCVTTEPETLIIEGKPRRVCGWEKHYVIRDTGGCARAKYGCIDYAEGTKIFMDSGGCGCMEPVFCAE